MYYLLFLLSLAAPALGNFLAQIVNGVYYEGTGVIIGPRFVLTAANLLERLQPMGFQISAGSENDREGERYDVLAYVFHPQYDPHNERRRKVLMEYDIAIIVLEKPIPLRPGFASQVDLPAVNQNFVGRTLKVYGWGFDSKQPALKYSSSDVNIVSKGYCLSTGYAVDCDITLVGTATQPECYADVGSPIVDGNVLAGINFDGNLCSQSILLATNIAKTVTWIKQVVHDYTYFY